MTGKIIVISLASAMTRRTEFARFTDDPMPWSFFDAHQIPDDWLDYDPALCRARFGRELTRGELGCYSSHITLWRNLLQDDAADFYVILEDDVRLDWGFMQLLLRDPAINELDYLRLYHMRPTPFREVQRGFVSPSKSLIELYGYAFGGQGYVMTKRGARRLVDRLRQVTCPIDDALDKVWRHGVRNLAIFPSPIFEREGESSLDADRNQLQGSKRHKRRTAFALRDKAAYWMGRLSFAIKATRRPRRGGVNGNGHD